MKAIASLPASWASTSSWPGTGIAPLVVVLAGIDSSEIVDAALTDSALTNNVIVRFEPHCAPPCDALFWRLETAGGQSLNEPGLLNRIWHRKPYAVTVRLVQYQPASAQAEVLDEGTLGTRVSRAAFRTAVERLAMRFVRDAALGRGRGPAGSQPADAAHGMPGWLDAAHATWHRRLMAEWWSIGYSTKSLEHVVADNGHLGEVTWLRTKAGDRYLADPFPWPGTDRILCEDMPMSGGVGRIVAVARQGDNPGTEAVILDDGDHHSYPCTLRDGESVYCVPESTARGATCIYRLEDDGQLVPVCHVAPHARLADSTLFRWNGQYWLGCTDLDLGGHDNLCLLYAPAITGPWTPHAKWPVKIDVRGARPAGTPFQAQGRLFRPGQDCAATYGAGVAIHEILTLTETDFREVQTAVLRPDRAGPFPDGLHTLVHDGERCWIDGKRFVFNFGLLRQKILGRAAHLFSGTGVG